MLGEGSTYVNNRSFGAPEKKFTINFSKANYLILHYNCVNSYLLVNGKEVYKFKADNGAINFPTQFCLESISHEFVATEPSKVAFKRNVYDFQSITILLINLTY